MVLVEIFIYDDMDATHIGVLGTNVLKFLNSFQPLVDGIFDFVPGAWSRDTELRLLSKSAKCRARTPEITVTPFRTNFLVTFHSRPRV